MFNKDFLLFDLEATGTDVTRHDIIQIGALLLDKQTLREKRSFSSYVQPTRWSKRDPEAMGVNGITWDRLESAPYIKQVLTQFTKSFPKSALLATYGGNLDVIFSSGCLPRSGYPLPFSTIIRLTFGHLHTRM